MAGKFTDWIPVGSSGAYHPKVRALYGHKVSGVYMIRDARGVLYVGESHTGRLYDTMTRHFRAWRVDPSRDEKGRRRGGTTYDRAKCEVCWIETHPDEAEAVQYELIRELQPRDNTEDCRSCADLPV